MKKIILLVTALCIFTMSNYAQQLQKGEYFFDTDPGVGHGTAIPFTPGVDSVVTSFSFGTTSLNIGFHALYIRFMNSLNQWGTSERKDFFKYDNTAPVNNTTTQIVKGEYYIDTDPGVGNGTSINFSAADSVASVLSFSISSLNIGFHQFYARYKNSAGVWGTSEGHAFYIYDATPSVQPITSPIAAMEYFIDNEDLGPGQCNPFNSFTQGDDVSETQDLAVISLFGLSPGIHSLNIRAKDASGKWSLFETKLFTVCTQPAVAAFNFSTSGTTVTFNNTSANDYGTKWIFGDGATDTTRSTSHTYTNGGTIQVGLISFSGCGNDTVYHNVTLNCVAPTPTFTSTINNLTAAFTSSAAGATDFSWNFGDTKSSTLQNPTHVYLATNTYNVCLTASNGCGSNVVCHNVSATCVAPVSSFTASVNGYTVALTNNSTNAANFNWNFGDATTNTIDYNPVKQYTNSGTYTIRLTVQNGCGSNFVQHAVTINCTAPQVDFNTNINGLGLEVDNVTANGSSWLWHFGDNTTSTFKNPAIHNFPSTGTYTVCLKATNVCGADSICHDVSVCTSPSAQYTSSSNGTNINFTNASTNGVDYLWNFGDGLITNIFSPAHQYQNSGTKNVCLTATNACGTNQICKNVLVSCSPFMNQAVCFVTVDTASLYNEIKWEKPVTTTIDSFIVYRKVTTTTYTRIGSVPYTTAGSFVDNTADPNNFARTYNIAVVDSCGNIGAIDTVAEHKTILLLPPVLGTGTVTLQWNFYLGANVDYYRISRWDNISNVYTAIDSVPGNTNAYVDNNILTSLDYTYRIEVNFLLNCSPSARTNAAATNTTRSNTRDNYRVTALSQLDANNVTLFPNPASELVNIILNANAYISNINVIDATGRLVKTVSLTNKNNQAQINTSDLARGIYFIEVNTNSGIVRKSFVRE